MVEKRFGMLGHYNPGHGLAVTQTHHISSFCLSFWYRLDRRSENLSVVSAKVQGKCNHSGWKSVQDNSYRRQAKENDEQLYNKWGSAEDPYVKSCELLQSFYIGNLYQARKRAMMQPKTKDNKVRGIVTFIPGMRILVKEDTRIPANRSLIIVSFYFQLLDDCLLFWTTAVAK